jgi:hypothetical protein
VQGKCHILQQNVLRLSTCSCQRCEDVLDQIRARSGDSRGLAGLAEILAWPSGREEIACWQRAKSVDALPIADVPEVLLQYSAGSGIVVADHHGLDASSTKADIEPANSSE